MSGYEPFRHLTLPPLSSHSPDFNLLHLILVLGDREMPVLCFPSLFSLFLMNFSFCSTSTERITMKQQCQHRKKNSPKSHCGQSEETVIDFMNPTKENS